jgi:hypothetical protein
MAGKTGIRGCPHAKPNRSGSQSITTLLYSGFFLNKQYIWQSQRILQQIFWGGRVNLREHLCGVEKSWAAARRVNSEMLESGAGVRDMLESSQQLVGSNSSKIDTVLTFCLPVFNLIRHADRPIFNSYRHFQAGNNSIWLAEC